MNRRTDAKGGNFIGRQTLELCKEIDHWFTQQSIATVHVVNNGQRSDFLYFPFNANISIAAAVAGDSDDSDVVAGDPHTFHPRRCCCCLRLVTMPLCEHPWYGVAHCCQELHAIISSVVVTLYTRLDSFVIKHIALFLRTTNLEAVPYYSSHSCAFIL